VTSGVWLQQKFKSNSKQHLRRSLKRVDVECGVFFDGKVSEQFVKDVSNYTESVSVLTLSGGSKGSEEVRAKRPK
jgi:hypothetical protein